MSIQSSASGDTATFIVPQKNIMPLSQELCFISYDQADRAGASVLANLLTGSGITEIKVKSNKDAYEIKIKLSGKKWNDTSSRGGRTYIELFKSGLTKKFITEKKPVFQSIADHLKPEFKKQIEETLNEFVKRKVKNPQGIEFSVDGHGGNISLKSYDPQNRSLIVEFSGACATACGPKHGSSARAITEQMLTAFLCEEFPNAFDRSRMRYEDLKK